MRLGFFILQKMEKEIKKTKVLARPNGPIIIDGEFTFDDGEGNITTEKRLSICRCAASRKMPFCDGTHNRIDFRS